MQIYWIWLSMIPSVGSVLQKRLLQAFQTPERIYQASVTELLEVKELGQHAAASIASHRSLEQAERVLDTLERTSTSLLTLDSPLYPAYAKSCPESPVVLYYQGTLPSRMHTAVTLVGTRRCSDYGRRVTKNLAAQLVGSNIPVISGMAKGIDGCAHQACIEAGGYTMAFVAGGPDICYPNEHKRLYEEIARHGAVISQYRPGTHPHPKRFIQRNALMSAWSTHVVIIEAGKRSGALTTAEFAQKYKRKLFAVPHQIDHQGGVGANHLLDGEARPYIDFDSLQITVRNPDSPLEMAAPEIEADPPSPILTLLQQGPQPVPVLVEKLALSPGALQEKLFKLELEGKVFTRGGLVKKV